MSHIVEYIIEINILNYNKQCKYIKNNLLSLKSCDISCIIFFKKIQVIVYRLLGYLVEFKDEIDEKSIAGLIFGMNCTIKVILMIMIGVLWG